MDLRDLIGPGLDIKNNNDPEFAVCWDSVIMDDSLLLDPKTKVAYFLQYSRAAMHFTSYINRIDFTGERTVVEKVELVASLMDSLICMSRISGLTPKEIPLKGLFKLDEKHEVGSLEAITIHDVTVFMWHNIIVCEVYTPWFSLVNVEKCDWQGIRDGLLVLFSLFSALCCKLDIDYETLCSHFVKKAKRDREGNSDQERPE